MAVSAVPTLLFLAVQGVRPPNAILQNPRRGEVHNEPFNVFNSTIRALLALPPKPTPLTYGAYVGWYSSFLEDCLRQWQQRDRVRSSRPRPIEPLIAAPVPSSLRAASASDTIHLVQHYGIALPPTAMNDETLDQVYMYREVHVIILPPKSLRELPQNPT